ncbi:MAG: VOC family protein, partial [Chloroflexota bacterium]|nr:VOC family protein [Chloroflexota bacterium]
PNLRHEGKPLVARCRSAVATVGSVMWELTEPLDEEGIFARFLREKGEGVHHIGVRTPNYYDLVAEYERRGETFPLSGSFAGVDVSYLPTDKTLGVLLEVFSGMPDEAQEIYDSADSGQS